jgi:hypothetical protein
LVELAVKENFEFIFRFPENISVRSNRKTVSLQVSTRILNFFLKNKTGFSREPNDANQLKFLA